MKQRLVIESGCREHTYQLRFPLGKSAGLIRDKSINGLHYLNSLSVLEQHPSVAPLPIATMIDMGVASPRAQGQAIMRTATAFTRA